VRDATRFADRVGVSEGDRVQIVLVATVKDFSQHLARDGKRELNAICEALEGRVVKVLDNEKPRRRRVKRAATT